MAMYPDKRLTTRESTHILGTTIKVSRSTFHALVTHGYIVQTNILRGFEYVLTDKGLAVADKAIRKSSSGEPEIPYRYCYNSHGWTDLETQNVRVVRGENQHIPSLDGYLAGDKLTLAYEGKIEFQPSPMQVCESLFRLFNAPWERPDEYAGPSMSVGDVITLHLGSSQEISFACAMAGFVQADISTSYIEPRPARWLRTVQQLGEYRKIKFAELDR